MRPETYIHTTNRPRKDFCVNGHERTAENVSPAGQCRICKRERYHAQDRQLVRIYVKSITGRLGNVTHCKEGHLRSTENVYPNGTCRPCAIEHSALRKFAVATTEPDEPFAIEEPFQIAPQAALEPITATIEHSDLCDTFNPEVMCGGCREILEEVMA